MTTDAPPAAPVVRVPGLRAATLLSLAAAGLLLVPAGLVAGSAGVAGTLVGAGLVVGFFVLGSVTTAVVAAFTPRASMLVALLTYTLQVLLLALVLIGLTRSGATDASLDVRWLAGTVIAATLAWTTGLLLHAVRSGTEGPEEPSRTGVRR